MARGCAWLLVGLLLVLAACSDEATDRQGNADPDINRTCLAGDPNCQDNPGLATGAPPEPPSGGVSVADALANDIDGGFAIEGFYFEDVRGVLFCQDLAESFPAQCGGPSIPFDNSAGADLGFLQSEQGITWSDQRIMVIGRLLDGVFVADQ